MNEFTTPIGDHAVASATPRRPPGASAGAGVRGWLLVLCLMFTVIGPLICAGLMANTYSVFAPQFAGSGGVLAVVLVSLAVTAGSAAYGVYAGLRLWRIRAGAVATAKQALLVGLAADIVSTMIEVAAGRSQDAADRLLWQFTFNLVPSLIFFTLCFAYLNRSNRVGATYRAAPGDV